ncbi:hypothetical protein Bbelb_204500 [Branchiostoma belcheri]|nr:hypothetical protein Bbelb_204500 [Branchiostoma belcheri]
MAILIQGQFLSVIASPELPKRNTQASCSRQVQHTSSRHTRKFPSQLLKNRSSQFRIPEAPARIWRMEQVRRRVTMVTVVAVTTSAAEATTNARGRPTPVLDVYAICRLALRRSVCFTHVSYYVTPIVIPVEIVEKWDRLVTNTMQ